MAGAGRITIAGRTPGDRPRLSPVASNPSGPASRRPSSAPGATAIEVVRSRGRPARPGDARSASFPMSRPANRRSIRREAAGPDLIVCDVIPNPPRTRLIREAQARGLTTSSMASACSSIRASSASASGPGSMLEAPGSDASRPWTSIFNSGRRSDRLSGHGEVGLFTSPFYTRANVEMSGNIRSRMFIGSSVPMASHWSRARKLRLIL